MYYNKVAFIYVSSTYLQKFCSSILLQMNTATDVGGKNTVVIIDKLE